MPEFKSGEVFFRDEAGALWLAQSFEDDQTHVVRTVDTLIEPVTTGQSNQEA